MSAENFGIFFMKNRRGEIATLLTLGLVLIGTAVTIATSFIANNRNNIASNPRAAGTNSCCKVYESSSACGGGKRIVNMGNAYTSTCAANAMVDCSSVGGPTTSGASICPATSGPSDPDSATLPNCPYTLTLARVECGQNNYESTGCRSGTYKCKGEGGVLNYGTAKTCSNNPAINYYQIGSKYYKSKTDTVGTTSLSSICIAPAAAGGVGGGPGFDPTCATTTRPDAVYRCCNRLGTPTGCYESPCDGKSKSPINYNQYQACSDVPVDPGTGAGGQTPGGGTTPGGIGYCCLVYKQGLYASQYGCDASQYAAKVVGFTGVKENGTAGYTSCATTGYEKYSGTYKVDDCSNISGAESLAIAGAGSICIGDPDTPPVVVPEAPAGPDEGELGGACIQNFNPLSFSLSYECNGSLVCSSQSDSGVCQNPQRTDTCTPQNSKNDGNTYGCFSNLYNDPAKSCKNISGQPNVYTDATGFTCKQSYQVCCKKPTAGNPPAGGNVTVACSQPKNCSNGVGTYVEGVQSTTGGNQLTQYFTDRNGCNTWTGGKLSVNDICIPSGAGAPPGGSTTPGGYSPDPNRSCNAPPLNIRFSDCSFTQFKQDNAPCSITTPLENVTGQGCSIFRVCTDAMKQTGDTCKYECYKDGKKHNCLGGANDPNNKHHVIHVANSTPYEVRIIPGQTDGTGSKVIKKYLVGPSDKPFPLSGVTLAPGQRTTYDLKDMNIDMLTCSSVSFNSIGAEIKYIVKKPDGDLHMSASGSDGCGGGVKILINITGQ